MICVSLPWPPAVLSPNSRAHWGQKARSAKWYRAQAGLLTNVSKGSVCVPTDGPIQVRIGFWPPDKRRRDWDNMLASVKSGLDGIAASLGVDDSRFQIELMRLSPVKPGMVAVVLSWTDERQLAAKGDAR